MEIKSNNNGNRRQRGNRSSGRNRNRRSNHQGNRSRNRGRSQSHGRSRSRKPAPPKPTTGQKILSFLTFGLLGKPTPPKASKPKAKKEAPTKSAPKPSETAAPSRRKRQRTEVTSGRLYVGNLDYAATEAELEDLFRGVGNVLSAEVVTNSRTQQSKGFAFVEMGSTDEAKRAVDILDDQDFMGRKLIVSGARSDGPRDGEDSEESVDEESLTESRA